MAPCPVVLLGVVEVGLEQWEELSGEVALDLLDGCQR
jgi:hypothetical protein